MTLDDVAAGVLILFGIHLGWHGPWPGAWTGPCEPRSLSTKIPALVMKPAIERRPLFRSDFEVGGKAELGLRSTAPPWLPLLNDDG